MGSLAGLVGSDVALSFSEATVKAKRTERNENIEY